jgi:hypothetical protein
MQAVSPAQTRSAMLPPCCHARCVAPSVAPTLMVDLKYLVVDLRTQKGAVCMTWVEHAHLKGCGVHDVGERGPTQRPDPWRGVMKRYLVPPDMTSLIIAGVCESVCMYV